MESHARALLRAPDSARSSHLARREPVLPDSASTAYSGRMYDFEETHETTATPESVWAIYTDVAGWKRWHGAIESVQFAGPFASGSEGHATVQIGLSQDIPFRIENVEPMKRFDVVWTVGPLLHTRMTHSIERTATGTKIKHAYHTGGIMAPFNFLQAAAAHDRAQPAMARIAQLAETHAVR